jgi:hypothetical protein
VLPGRAAATPCGVFKGAAWSVASTAKLYGLSEMSLADLIRDTQFSHAPLRKALANIPSAYGETDDDGWIETRKVIETYKYQPVLTILKGAEIIDRVIYHQLWAANIEDLLWEFKVSLGDYLMDEVKRRLGQDKEVWYLVCRQLVAEVKSRMPGDMSLRTELWLKTVFFNKSGMKRRAPKAPEAK